MPEIKLDLVVDGIDQAQKLQKELIQHTDNIHDINKANTQNLEGSRKQLTTNNDLAKQLGNMNYLDLKNLKITQDQNRAVHTAIFEKKQMIREMEREHKIKREDPWGYAERVGRPKVEIETEVKQGFGKIRQERENLQILQERARFLNEMGNVEAGGAGGMGGRAGSGGVAQGFMAGLGWRRLAPAYLAYRAGQFLTEAPKEYLAEQQGIYGGITGKMGKVSEETNKFTDNLESMARAAMLSRQQTVQLVSSIQDQAYFTKLDTKEMTGWLETIKAYNLYQEAPQIAKMGRMEGKTTPGGMDEFTKTLMGARGAFNISELPVYTRMVESYQQSRRGAGYTTGDITDLTTRIGAAGTLYKTDVGLAVQNQIQSAFQSGGAAGGASRAFFMRAYGMGTGSSYYRVSKRMEEGWTGENWAAFQKQLQREYGYGGEEMKNLAASRILGTSIQNYENLKESMAGPQKPIDATGELTSRKKDIGTLDINLANAISIKTETIKVIAGKFELYEIGKKLEMGKSIIDVGSDVWKNLGSPEKGLGLLGKGIKALTEAGAKITAAEATPFTIPILDAVISLVQRMKQSEKNTEIGHNNKKDK